MNAPTGTGGEMPGRNGRPGPQCAAPLPCTVRTSGWVALLAVIVFSSIVGLAPSFIILKIIDDALDGAIRHGSPARVPDAGRSGATAFSGVAQSYLSQSIGQSVMFDLRRRSTGTCRNVDACSLRCARRGAFAREQRCRRGTGLVTIRSPACRQQHHGRDDAALMFYWIGS